MKSLIITLFLSFISSLVIAQDRETWVTSSDVIKFYEGQITSYKKERNKRTGKAILHPSLVLGFGAVSLLGSNYILSKEPLGSGSENEIAYYTAGIGGALAGVFFLFKSIESLVETGNYQSDKEEYKIAKEVVKNLRRTNRSNVSFSPIYNPIHKMYGFNLRVGL